jgi:hypothetical protein
MKLLVILVVVMVLLLVVAMMRRSWQRGAVHRAIVLAPFPKPPAELTGPDGAALLPEAGGVYLGTSMAGDWQDQVSVGDIAQQATATLHLSRAGLLVDRSGATPLWIPASSMRGAHPGRAVAGKVMSADGTLVITWQLGGHLLDTGFRGDEAVYPDWVEMVRSIAEGQPPGPHDDEVIM